MIQFRNDSGTGKEQLAGRIEHVNSGRTETFSSLQELSKQLLKMLQQASDANSCDEMQAHKENDDDSATT